MWVGCGWVSGLDVIYFGCFQALTFQKINRIITAVDSQPMFDGGVLINVLGRLQVRFVGYVDYDYWKRSCFIDGWRSTSCLRSNVRIEAVWRQFLRTTRHIPPRATRLFVATIPVELCAIFNPNNNACAFIKKMSNSDVITPGC